MSLLLTSCFKGLPDLGIVDDLVYMQCYLWTGCDITITWVPRRSGWPTWLRRGRQSRRNLYPGGKSYSLQYISPNSIMYSWDNCLFVVVLDISAVSRVLW